MNTIKTYILSIFLLLVSFVLYPTLGYAAQNWPADHCTSAKAWLKFSEMNLCLKKSQVIRLDYLNLSMPSLAMRFYDRGKEELNIVLSRLDDEKITGGLHTRLGIGVQDVFKILTGDERADKDKIAIIRRVMDAGDGTTVRWYTDGDVDAYTLIRPREANSSIYIFHKNRSGAIEISGNLSESDAMNLLSEISWQ